MFVHPASRRAHKTGASGSFAERAIWNSHSDPSARDAARQA